MRMPDIKYRNSPFDTKKQWDQDKSFKPNDKKN